MIVLDASAVVALLVDSGSVGAQVGATLLLHDFAYPSLLPYEVASALRRLAASSIITPQLAVRSLHDGAQLNGQTFEFAELAERVWELRHNISTYDASYIALAELLDVPLLTLDSRLRAAPGVRCEFVDLPAPEV
jgi:predicted nucleic acid-binding protein